MQPLTLRHRVPLLTPDLIPQHVIHLREQVYYNIQDAERNQNPVSALIARRVVRAVDVRRDNAGCLNEHVVEGCGDSA